VERASIRGWGGVQALLIVACAFYLAGLVWVGRPLTWDELEFFRATDSVRTGEVPYLDFYEHHAPLQWFLFAPLTGWLTDPGIATIQAMRWAQLALWLATLALLGSAARRCGASARLATLLVVLLGASSAFAHSAVEYRVDAVGSFFLVAGIWLALGADGRRTAWLGAGASFAAAGLANLRLGAVLAVVFLATTIYSPAERRWRWNGSLPFSALGAALVLAPVALYFAFRGALAEAGQRLFVDNAIGNAALPRTPGLFLDRIALALGLRTPPDASLLHRALDLDLAGLALVAFGLVGAFLALRHARSGSATALVALAQVTNLLFVLRMKALYSYHFQTLLLLSVLLVPAVVPAGSEKRARAAVAAVAALALAAGITNLVQRNFGARLAYQDRIMTEVAELVPPGNVVWDGAGFALRRPSVRSDLWFLPQIVRTLSREGRIPPFGVAEIAADPPAAIVFSGRMYYWFAEHGELGEWTYHHYAPYLQHLWLPMPNTLLTPGSGSRSWTVAATGTYRVVASPRLATHPWFRTPGRVGLATGPHIGQLALPLAAVAGEAPSGLEWSIDGGEEIVGPGFLSLRRGQRVGVRWEGLPRAAGLFLVPAGVDELFQAPANGDALDLPPRFPGEREPTDGGPDDAS